MKLKLIPLILSWVCLEFIGYCHCKHHCKHWKSGTLLWSVRMKYMMRICLIHPNASWLDNYTFLHSQSIYRLPGVFIVKPNEFRIFPSYKEMAEAELVFWCPCNTISLFHLRKLNSVEKNHLSFLLLNI